MRRLGAVRPRRIARAEPGAFISDLARETDGKYVISTIALRRTPCSAISRLVLWASLVEDPRPDRNDRPGMRVTTGAAIGLTAKIWRRWNIGNKPRRPPLLGRVGSRYGDVSVSDTFSEQLVASLPRLRRFARGLTGTVAQADDLVQSACERALTRRHQFQEGTRFDSWMFRIAQTLWIDHLRSRDVRKEETEVDGEKIGSDEPVRRAEARLALEEVRRAAARLPPEQRAALMLVTVDGFSYKEAAEIAQVPVGTIMSRLARARVALMQILEQGGGLRGSTDDAAAQR